MSEKSKQFLFWIITIAFPFLVLVLIEIGLRIGGYNADKQNLFIQVPNNSEYISLNTGFVERYFPSFVPGIAPNPFRLTKKPRTFRIFVFGGSSAKGYPYNFYYSFADILEQKLLLDTEGLTIEVINLGMTAVNSYVIHDLSKRIMPYEPDAIVIYAGHNEYYGSFGAGTTQYGFVNSIGLKRLILKLKNYRLYQLFEEILKKDEVGVEQRTMMAKVVREADIEFEGEIYQQGIEQFERNLGDVLKQFQSKEIPVYIGTVASNLKDQPPLSDQEEVLEVFKSAQTAFNEEKFEEAFELFNQAKEIDPIRFRAPNAINEKIRELSNEYGAFLVDIESLLRSESESGIEDNSLFTDHLHPTSEGHFIMAELFLNEIVQLDRLTRYHLPNPFDVPNQLSRFEEVYSNTSISRLLVGYPFEKGLTEAEELAAFNRIYIAYLSASYVDSVAAYTSRNIGEVPKALTDIVNHGMVLDDSLMVMSHYYELLKWQLNSIDLVERGIEFSTNNRNYDMYLVNILHQVINDGLNDYRYMDVLSALYLLNNIPEKAKYWLEESEKAGSTDPRFYYNYARYHILNGDTVSASRYYSLFLQSQQRSN